MDVNEINLPPGPPDTAWIDTFNLDRLAFMRDAQKRWGNMVRFPVSTRRALWLVNDPVAIEQVLVHDVEKFGRGSLFKRRGGKFLGRGLLVVDGEINTAHRRMMMPAFHRVRLAQYAQAMVEEADNTLAAWPVQGAETVAISRSMATYTMRVVARCLFGEDGLIEVDQVMRALTACLEYLDDEHMPLPEAEAAYIHQVASSLVEQRRVAESDDLVSLLLAARYEDGSPLTTRQIVDEALTLFVAGYETSANALSWMLYLLSQHPEAQARLRSEAQQTPDAALLTAEMPYLSAVINEGLRLYAPAWNLTREVLADVTLAGYHVPKGHTLIISPFVAHRSAEFWPEPDTFRPERFLGENGASWDRRMFLPFSMGPRFCIGRPFAMLEMKIMLARIMARYTLPQPPDHPVEVEPLLVVRPRGGMTLQVAPLGSGSPSYDETLPEFASLN